MGEMKWKKIRDSKLDFEAYKDWVNVFFEDRFARYVLFSVNKSDPIFTNFYRQKRRGNNPEERKVAYQEGLSAVFHQFLLHAFGMLHDTKRWLVYPDKGLFRQEVLEMTKKQFNLSYKFPKSSNNICSMQPRESDEDDLLQLADVLLGAFSHDYFHASVEKDTQKDILIHCRTAIQQNGFTERKLPKLDCTDWVLEDQYDYSHNFTMPRSARWTQSYH